MRTIIFNVCGQKISAGSDVSGIVGGSFGYLQFQFGFDKSWEGCKNIAVFKSQDLKIPVLLNEDGICSAPKEMRDKPSFWVYAVGVKPGLRIESEGYLIVQGGK